MNINLPAHVQDILEMARTTEDEKVAAVCLEAIEILKNKGRTNVEYDDVFELARKAAYPEKYLAAQESESAVLISQLGGQG